MFKFAAVSDLFFWPAARSCLLSRHSRLLRKPTKAISPALPDLTTTFQLEEVGPECRISYKDGAADVTTTMGPDYAISVMRMKTAEFDSTIKSQFKKSPRGLLLSSYQDIYR